jgi:hypothetical protein
MVVISEARTHSVESLSRSRVEHRWNIPPEHVDETNAALQKYEHIHYDNPWVTTVYFGGVDSDGFVSHLPTTTLKARFYTKEPWVPNIALLPLDTSCIFELKIHPPPSDSIGGLDIRPYSLSKKYRIRTNLGELNNALFSGKYDALTSKKLENHTDDVTFPGNILANILKHHNVLRFSPVGVTQYKRNHYFLNGHSKDHSSIRVTHDENVSFWEICWLGYEFGAITRQMDGQNNILEIKNIGGPSLYPPELNELVKKLQPTVSKHNTIFGLASQTIPRLIWEVDYKKNSDGWLMSEQEKKVDLTADPRPWLRNLVQFSDSSYLISSAHEQATRQYFLPCELSGATVCVMSYPNTERQNRIKAKRPNPESNGSFIREELSLIDSPEARIKVHEFLQSSFSDQDRTSSFSRLRVVREIVSQLSGRVFEITADCCIADDGRPNMNQIEVEYDGTIPCVDRSDRSRPSVQEELELMRSLVLSSLRMSGLDGTSSVKTKYQWVSTPPKIIN